MTGGHPMTHARSSSPDREAKRGTLARRDDSRECGRDDSPISDEIAHDGADGGCSGEVTLGCPSESAPERAICALS
jgi:hypothetical protein